MKRIHYLVCYDVADPQRLRQVARVLEGYGYRLQMSVFECFLDRQRLAELRSSLRRVVNHEEDQVLFVSLGQADQENPEAIETLGLPYAGRTRMTII